MGIENDLISVSRAKLTWFLCDGRKWLDFSIGIEIDLVFLRGLKLTRFLCADRKLYSVRGSIDLFSVWVVENDLVFVCCLRSSGNIRGTTPGFLWGYGSWGETDVAPCCWEHHPQLYFFSVVLLGNN